MNKIRRPSIDRASGEHKRLSFSRSHRISSPPPPPPASFDLVIESPPLVFYGPPSTSTGALLSAQVIFDVVEYEMKVDSMTVALLASVTVKKPVHGHCAECATKVSDLVRVDLLKEPTLLKPRRHAFPFSYLLPGHLPATSHGTLALVDYKIAVDAVSSTGSKIHLERPLDVQRAILPGPDRTSTRIFPPTTLTAFVGLPSVVHPIGEFPVQLRLEKVVKRGKETQTRWRLRKLTWRIEEHAKMISPACARHAHKVGGEGKGIAHQDTRSLASQEFKSGWKTDFDTGDGSIEMEFPAAIRPDTKPVCDVESNAGLAVHHTLVLELVVSEDFCPNRNTKSITPTGAARVLRMTFGLVVTARSGLGISWDEEQPPIYGDVPPSPPSYTRMDDYEGEVLEETEFERL
ncbi:MAG: hypothetical protein M1823_000923 [Watsoniomyces obsoletus]|nr:MAG: hypothetical protein M1823_000923 [Watsoniomyces obsoletus]